MHTSSYVAILLLYLASLAFAQTTEQATNKTNDILELNELQLLDELDKGVRMNATSFLFVKFWAPRCPFSELMHPIFTDVATLFPNVTFASVNALKYSALNSRWNIVAFPTLILYGRGELVARCNNRSSEGIIKFLQERTKTVLVRTNEEQKSDAESEDVNGSPPPTAPSLLGDVKHNVFLWFASAYVGLRMCYFLAFQWKGFRRGGTGEGEGEADHIKID